MIAKNKEWCSKTFENCILLSGEEMEFVNLQIIATFNNVLSKWNVMEIGAFPSGASRQFCSTKFFKAGVMQSQRPWKNIAHRLSTII